MKTILRFLFVCGFVLAIFVPISAQIHLSPYVDNTGRDVCLAVDTERGRSVFYAWNNDISNWKAYAINLPAQPIPGSANPIMMHPYVDNSGRDVVLAWDVTNGQSIFYAWNNDISNWKAYAVNLPESPIPGAAGPFMMVPYVDNTGRDVCLIWDVNSGKSLFYAWNNDISNWKAYAINLPEQPVGDAAGMVVMFPYVDNTGRDVCLTWDTKSGKSVFYAWSNDISNWKAYGINLPENPVPDAQGEIMFHPYVDNTGRDVCLVWDVETGKSVFYAWNNDISNWKAYAINLPAQPVGEAHGSIMLYPYVDNTGRDVCLAWDAQSGISTFYAWNNDISNWKAYTINLPEELFDSAEDK